MSIPYILLSITHKSEAYLACTIINYFKSYADHSQDTCYAITGNGAAVSVTFSLISQLKKTPIIPPQMRCFVGASFSTQHVNKMLIVHDLEVQFCEICVIMTGCSPNKQLDL